MGNSCTRIYRLDGFMSKLPQVSDKNTILWESVINIVLVHLNGLQNCVIESYRFEHNGQPWMKNWPILYDFICNLQLNIEYDPTSLENYPRYIISRDGSIAFAPPNICIMNHIYVRTGKGILLRVHSSTDQIKDLATKWQKLWDIHTQHYGHFIFFCESHD